MSVNRFVPILAVALGLSLTSCHDARRDVVRDFLQRNPPDGFEVVEIPGKFAITGGANGTSETVFEMRYRLTRPTVETHDLFSLPRGADLAKRISGIRGWALSSLPAGDPIRETIASTSASARAPFPVKRVVTPKGAEIEALVSVTLSRKPGGWQVESAPPTVNAPGSPDSDPRIPFEDSTEVAAKFNELETTAHGMEELRQKSIVDRQRAAERSLATFRAILKTGNTFEGRLSDQTPVRMVISQGADMGGSVIAVVTVQRADRSSARYTGGITQQPSGESIWRAAQVASLSGSGGDAVTDASFHPILTMKATGDGLTAEVKADAGRTFSFKLSPAGKVDLIPGF